MIVRCKAYSALNANLLLWTFILWLTQVFNAAVSKTSLSLLRHAIQSHMLGQCVANLIPQRIACEEAFLLMVFNILYYYFSPCNLFTLVKNGGFHWRLSDSKSPQNSSMLKYSCWCQQCCSLYSFNSSSNFYFLHSLLVVLFWVAINNDSISLFRLPLWGLVQVISCKMSLILRLKIE